MNSEYSYDPYKDTYHYVVQDDLKMQEMQKEKEKERLK